MVTLAGGLIALLLGIISLITFWDEFITLVVGCIPVALLLGGALATYLGMEESKDKKRAELESASEPFTPQPQEVDQYKQEVADLKAKLAAMEDKEEEAPDQEAEKAPAEDDEAKEDKEKKPE
jgi:hypothetical protein